jgi:hypothetical protein
VSNSLKWIDWKLQNLPSGHGNWRPRTARLHEKRRGKFTTSNPLPLVCLLC